MNLSSGTNIKRKRQGRLKEWSPELGVLRVPLMPGYLECEAMADEELDSMRNLIEEEPT